MNIHNRCAATVLGDDLERGGDQAGESGGKVEWVGERSNKRKMGAAGLARKKKKAREDADHELVSCIGKMTEHIGAISREIGRNEQMSEARLKDMVKREVEERLRLTNAMLKNVTALLQELRRE